MTLMTLGAMLAIFAARAWRDLLEALPYEQRLDDLYLNRAPR